MKKRYLFLILVCFTFLGCVEPQKIAVLENRVAAMEMENNRRLSQQNALTKKSAAQSERLQSKIETDLHVIQARLDNSHVFSKEEYAQLKYDIQELREQIQQIQGAVEDMETRLDEFRQNELLDFETRMERLDLAISNNYEKVIRLEKHMGFEPTGPGKDQGLAGETKDLTKDSEDLAYSAAKKLFDEGRMDAARIQFENFITKYPDSSNADNARFWIADSFYSEKRFAEAILEYQKVLETYPDSNKLAAARLKQGYAFEELGEHANARLILKELLKKYPDSQEAQYAAEKLKNLK